MTQKVRPDVPCNTYTRAVHRCNLPAKILKVYEYENLHFPFGRVVIRLGSSMPFSQELNELQEEVKPLWKLRSCPRDFKRTSVERLFREARFALDWCSFRLVSFVYRLKQLVWRIRNSRDILCVLGRAGATESAARKRETGTERIGFTGFRNFRARGVAMGQIEQSQYPHEKLLRRNCHHDLCVCYPVLRIGRFAQYPVVPGSRKSVSVYVCSI